MRFIEVIATLPLCIIAVSMLLRTFLRPRELTLIQIGFIIYVIYFCAGPLVFGATNVLKCDINGVLYCWLTVYLFWTTVWISAVLIRSPLKPIGLLVDDHPEYSNGIMSWLAYSATQVKDIHLVLGAVAFLVFRAVLQMKYGLFFSGGWGWKYALDYPYWVRAVTQVLRNAGLGLAVVAVIKLSARLGNPLILVPVLVSEFAATFFLGRRRLFSFLIVCLGSFLIPRRRIKVKHSAIIVAVLLFFWLILFPLFFNMRFQWQNHPEASMVSWFTTAVEELRQDKFREENSKEDMVQRVQNRLCAISQGYAIATLIPQRGVVGVKLFIGSLVKPIPSVLFPWKREFETSLDATQAVGYGLGSAKSDMTTQLPTEGMTAFGFMGGIVYGLIFVIIIRLFELVYQASLKLSLVGSLLVFGIFVPETTLQMENYLGVFLNSLRNAVIIYILLRVYRMFIPLRQNSLPAIEPMRAGA
ncbi:MAG: hypothetical protein GC164_16225 [Phycisphaera sp.]|nr:hypothetical protein [Phycisphaera sp.]